MKYINKITKCVLFIFAIAIMASCAKEDKFTDSIFSDEEEKFNSFEKWLHANFLDIYNLDFRYRMQDVGSNTNYNLVPTKLEKSQEMAILVKYLWFDVYSEIVSPEFLRKYGPRMIHLIGSAAYNPNQGTRILGTAEGGIKVTLYDCNQLKPDNIAFNNEYYFHTMHHEFMHILHQQKAIPKVFETLSAGYYDPMYWQEREDKTTTAEQEVRDHSMYAPLGFVTAYGSSQPREDFVEVIACYITKTDKWWTELLKQAAKPGPNNEPIRGDVAIKEKIEIAKKWLSEQWGIDLDEIRDNVRARQVHVLDAVVEGKLDIENYEND